MPRRRHTAAAPKVEEAGVPSGSPVGHSRQALALLDALADEASENAVARGEAPWEDGEDDWTAAEREVLDMVAAAVDRRVDLESRYADAEDKIKMSQELRLLQAHIATLLKQVKTDVPPEPSRTSQKASQAANTRWSRGG